MLSASWTADDVLERLNSWYAPTVLTIPDNPTNGDMIKAMFPDVHYVLASQGTPRVVTNLDASFDLDWWSAPYKAESEPQGSEDK